MGISNELSSDVVIALLAKKKSSQELQQLKNVILQVHSALQKMSKKPEPTVLNGNHRKAPKTHKYPVRFVANP